MIGWSNFSTAQAMLNPHVRDPATPQHVHVLVGRNFSPVLRTPHRFSHHGRWPSPALQARSRVLASLLGTCLQPRHLPHMRLSSRVSSMPVISHRSPAPAVPGHMSQGRAAATGGARGMVHAGKLAKAIKAVRPKRRHTVLCYTRRPRTFEASHGGRRDHGLACRLLRQTSTPSRTCGHGLGSGSGRRIGMTCGGSDRKEGSWPSRHVPTASSTPRRHRPWRGGLRRLFARPAKTLLPANGEGRLRRVGLTSTSRCPDHRLVNPNP